MTSNSYKILIWGTGIDYDSYLNNIRYEELKGNLEVTALVASDKYCNQLDGYKVIGKSEIKDVLYDYIIIASTNKYDEIMSEALSLGIDKKRLLKITIFRINNFDFKSYIHLYESNISIISNNCWGGLTYNSLGMEFLSPFINMYLAETDYLKLLSDLNYYLHQPLIFDKEMYENNLKRNFPIALLDDVPLYFNHYKSFEEAETKWVRRLQRINYDNLFITFYTTSLKAAEQFENLPFDRKVVFVPFKCDLPSAVELDNFQDILPQKFNNELFHLIISLALSKYKCYDILKLLGGDNNYRRTN